MADRADTGAREPHEFVGRVEPHRYEYGGFEVQGDCAVCGHVQDSPLHVDALAAGVGVPPDETREMTKDECVAYLRDGHRPSHLLLPPPEVWREAVEELIDAGVLDERDRVFAGVGEARPAEEWRANENSEKTPSVGAPAEEQPDARGYIGPVAQEITYDAQREPMFQDEQGNGWVPLARFHEEADENQRLREQLDAAREALRMAEAHLSLIRYRGEIRNWSHPAMPDLADVDKTITAARAALGVVAAAEQTTDLEAHSAKNAEVRADAGAEAPGEQNYSGGDWGIS